MIRTDDQEIRSELLTHPVVVGRLLKPLLRQFRASAINRDPSVAFPGNTVCEFDD